MAIATVRDVREISGLSSTQKSDNDIRAMIEYASREIKSKSRKTFTGVINKERVGVSNGLQRRFFVSQFPILDKTEESGGVETNDSSKIQVETWNTSDDTFETVDSTDYEIHGSEGLVLFKNSTIPASGLEIYISYKHSLFFVRRLEALLASVRLLFTVNDKHERYIELKKEYDADYTKFIGTDYAFFSIRNVQDRPNSRNF